MILSLFRKNTLYRQDCYSDDIDEIESANLSLIRYTTTSVYGIESTLPDFLHIILSSEILIIKNKLECGPVPNVMVALPNIGGALCSTPQSLARAHCSSAVQ